MPKVAAILVLGSDGDRLAGKYYGDFLKVADDGHSREETRHNFKKEVQQKIGGIVARPDAAEVVSVRGKTVVFCGGSTQGAGWNVRIVHVGPSNESELVLAMLCEGMYDALSQQVTKSKLKEAWATASVEDIKEATILSKQLQQQSPFLQTEVQKVLKQTNGSVTWREVARQISGNSIQAVCANTIADYIMSLPGSSYNN